MQCNVSKTERLLTGIAGAALAAYGLKRGSRAGGALMLAGGGLLMRATTGYCPVYAAMGRNEDVSLTKEALGGSRGIHVRKSITIDRPVDHMYAFWRNFENLPRFMEHLESVETMDDRHSRWVVRGPAGTNVEWNAEVIHEEPNKVIGWRTLKGSDVISAGSVNFDPSADGRSTRLNVVLQYQPPGGTLGSAVASLFGEEPSQQIEQDLRRLKRHLEAGDTERRAIG